MGKSIVLVGAHIKLYINNKLYKVGQTIMLDLDYGETEIYGIDSAHPQEIAPTKVSVRGNVTGLRIKQSGGLQGINARPLFTDIAASPYISIRIQDRSTGEDIIFIPQAKVTKETITMATRATVKANFSFSGIVGLQPLDRA